MTQTTIKPRRTRRIPGAPADWKQNTVRWRIKRAAVTIGAMPREQHRDWLGVLLADLGVAGVDVELLQCALAEE